MHKYLQTMTLFWNVGNRFVKDLTNTTAACSLINIYTKACLLCSLSASSLSQEFQSICFYIRHAIGLDCCRFNLVFLFSILPISPKMLIWMFRQNRSQFRRFDLSPLWLFIFGVAVVKLIRLAFIRRYFYHHLDRVMLSSSEFVELLSP